MLTNKFINDIFDKSSRNDLFGRLAQLVRAPALQAGGHRFESYIAHHFLCRNGAIGSATDL